MGSDCCKQLRSTGSLDEGVGDGHPLRVCSVALRGLRGIQSISILLSVQKGSLASLLICLLSLSQFSVGFALGLFAVGLPTWFNAYLVQCLPGSMLTWFNSHLVQRLLGSMPTWFKDYMVQCLLGFMTSSCLVLV